MSKSKEQGTSKSGNKKRKQKNAEPDFIDHIPRQVKDAIIFAVAVFLFAHINDSPKVAITDSGTCDLSSSPSSVGLTEKEIWQRIYAWCGTITHQAQAHNIDPYVIAAIIWVESGGNFKAESIAGAIGLMQVMPNDGLAAQIYGSTFARRPSSEQLLNPVFNIQTGVELLASNIERLGSLREALKAYGPANAGYSYADKVLSLYYRIKA